jgi:hypothetical protein
MSILLLMDAPGASVEAYDRTNELMGIRGDADAPEGLLSHCCGVDDTGLLVADVWESEAALNRFFEERLGAALAQTGLQTTPRILPLHNLIPQGAGTVPGVLLVWEADSFTPDAYDAITSKMAAHRGDGSGHPAVSHAAATTGGGMVFVDIWDSPESAGRFLETEIGPAAGGDLPVGKPRFVQVHNRLVGRVRA